MEGNYALILIKRADYCALKSLDTGLDVAHVTYSAIITYMSRGLGRSLWRAPHTHVRLRGATLSRAVPGAPDELDHRVLRPMCMCLM